MKTSMTTEPPEATRLRDTCVDQLKEDGVIVSPAVETVMRRVPRHAFAPHASLGDAYSPYAAVITKISENGVQLSSVSAPQIQAMMLEQAQLRPGDRVLEVGSGGLNAAYLAELVGEEANVTTVDIDPEVTGRARRLLDTHGYTGVRVVTADASEPVPELGEVDVVLVTVGAWDIPPVWIDQLKSDGRLVVPLRMRGLTRSVAFQRVADAHGVHLESTTSLVCGFVPMQGSGQHDETQILVNGTPEIALRFDDGAPAAPHRLDNAVRTPRVERWTGVTVALGEPFSGLQMHLAIELPGFCVMSVDPQLDTGLVSPRHQSFSPAAVDGDTFAYVTTRRTPDERRAEFGVHALGPNADTFADGIVTSVRAWDREHRGAPDPLIRVYPAGTSDDAVFGDRVIEKRHSRISLSWPPA